jgi:hypothetical protein
MPRRRAACICLAASISVAAAAEPWLQGDLVDYAPAGVPDFSQCRGPWSRPGSPPQWTHAGPVALADALWWLDSVFEPDPRPPAVVHDGHSLVTAYPEFGRPRDDHSPENLTLLVEDLSLRCDTDGARTSESRGGTRWDDLVAGAESYIGDRHLGGTYRLATIEAPPATWLSEQARQGAAAVLLLGVWEQQADAWLRVGGHYAALTGIDATVGWVALSDPLADSAAYGGGGVAVPQDAELHSCREAPRAHDDAGVVSHDTYPVRRATELPREPLVLEGYFVLRTYGDAAAFRDQNAAPFLAQHIGTWHKGSVVMAVDAALVIAPVAPPLPTDASPTDAPRPTSTPGGVLPSPGQVTATDAPNAPASASPTPASAPSGTTAHANPGPTATPTVEAMHAITLPYAMR